MFSPLDDGFATKAASGLDLIAVKGLEVRQPPPLPSRPEQAPLPPDSGLRILPRLGRWTFRPLPAGQSSFPKAYVLFDSTVYSESRAGQLKAAALGRVAILSWD